MAIVVYSEGGCSSSKVENFSGSSCLNNKELDLFFLLYMYAALVFLNVLHNK